MQLVGSEEDDDTLAEVQDTGAGPEDRTMQRQALESEKQLAADARAEIVLLNQQLQALRAQLGEISQALAGTICKLGERICQIAERQPDVDNELRGPPVKVAFDADGNELPGVTA